MLVSCTKRNSIFVLILCNFWNRSNKIFRTSNFSHTGAYVPHQMIFVVIFSVRFSVLEYSILKHTGFWLFFARLPQLHSGSFPVRVYVIREVVDKAFSVKTYDFEFGFPFDPELSKPAKFWKASGKVHRTMQVVEMKGVRARSWWSLVGT